MVKETVIAGTRVANPRHIALEEIVSRTVQAVLQTTVEGEHGDEPCIKLEFTDGTEHGFVLPSDNWEN
jgi:hypothetical protein